MAPSDHWKEISALYAAALERPEAERAAYVTEACAGNESLRQEIESLLACHTDAQQLLTSPATEILAAAMATSEAPLVGRQLGAYRIEARLGAGGMGEVYRATDTRLHRAVAIKILPQHLRDNPVLRQRLEREAQAAAALRHPQICVLHDVGHADGIDFLVMELLDGETLADRLARAPLPLPDAIRHALEIVDALVATHAHGLVHRDLKPSNVMLTGAGAKLLDFGIAKLHRAPSEDLPADPVADALTASSSTTLGPGETNAAGTPRYMTPEQIDRKRIDHRSDIFSFGVLLYEMLAGRRAFDGPDRAGLAEAIRRREPPPLPSEIRAAAPGLDDLIARCLRKDPAERWPDAHTLAGELRRVAAAAPPAAPARPRTRRRIELALASCIAVPLLAWGVWWPSEDERPQVTLVPLGAEERPFEGPVLSPNGEYIAYTTMDKGEVRLYIRDLSNRIRPQSVDASMPTILIASSTQFGLQPFFSPDSSWIGFFDGGRMWKASVRGGGRTPIVDRVPQPRGASWGDDGFILYAPQFRTGLWRVSANGGTPRQVTAPDAALGETGHEFPSVLPGGRVVLFQAAGRSWQQKTLVAYSFDTTRRTAVVRNRASQEEVSSYSVETAERRDLVEDGGAARYTAGQLVYLEGTSLMAGPFDVGRLDFTGPRIRVMSDVKTFSLSDTGSLLYRSVTRLPPNSWLVWVNRDGSFERVAGLPHEISHARVCPTDSNRLVFERYAHIWTYNAAGGALNQITSIYSNSGPVWTPACDRVFFAASNRLGRTNDVISIRADGSGNETVSAEAGGQGHLDVALNGQWLAYQTTGPGPKGVSRTIWLRGLNADAVSRPLTKEAEVQVEPALSPDGQWVAYASTDATGQYDVYVRAIDGSRRRRVSRDGGREPAWNPDGREIFYRQGDKLVAASVLARASRLEIGPTAVLFEGPYKPAGVSSRSYDVSPDGKRFLMVRREAGAIPKPTILLKTNWVEELKRLLASS